MFIFKSLGLKCIPFLPQIMPPFLQCMRTKETILLKFLFKQLGLLVAIVKQHIRVPHSPARPTGGLRQDSAPANRRINPKTPPLPHCRTISRTSSP
jgi:hypothetical protein